MKPGEESKIVNFCSGTSTELLTCVLCGQSNQSGTCCEVCASGMLDVGLSVELAAEDEYPKLVVDDCDLPGPPAPVTPLRYEHYEICCSESGVPCELGHGAMGITYKAFDTDLHCTVALKVINPAILADYGAGERFLHEARSLAQLRHPNIATIHRLATSEGRYFYAMEYIEGETLEAYICRKGAFHYKTALELITQAAQGLGVAHRKTFVHRDIKPSNIMLVEGKPSTGGNLTLKLIDFGLVKAMDDDVLPSGYFAGSPYFASPEQWSAGKVDSRSDLYSLGVCLWYMLTGTLPKLALSSVDGWRQHLPAPLPKFDLSATTPACVIALLESMVAQDPAARPQTADELLERIKRIRSPRKFHALSAVGVSLVLLIVVGLLKMKAVNQAEREAHVKAKAFYAEGEEYFRKHTSTDNQKAVGLYSHAIAEMPNFADAHAALAMAEMQSATRYGLGPAHLDNALLSAQKAIAINPSAPKGFHALGVIRSFQGKSWEALEQLRHALELDPKYLSAMRDFSLLWSSVGQPQIGLVWARAAASLDPSDMVAWHVAADASTDLCADDQAEEYSRRCLEINPMWMSGICGSLHLHLLQGDFARARKDFELAHSVDPDLLLPLTLKAQIELFSGNYAEAEQVYRQLIKTNRTGLVNYYGGISYLSALGFLRLRASDTTEAAALLDEASKLRLSESEGPQVIYDLAAIRAIQGRTEDALSLLQQAISSGWMDYRVTLLDPRFESLREEVRFHDIIKALSAHVGAMRAESEHLSAKSLSIADYPVRPLKP